MRSEVEAVVRVWNDEEGWGVLDSEATPGGCWTHYSALDMDGHHSATSGQQGRLVYERADQDGFEWRAVRVRLDGASPRSTPTVPADSPTSAYQSHLDISFD